MTKNQPITELIPGDKIYIKYGLDKLKAKVIHNIPSINTIILKVYLDTFLGFCITYDIKNIYYDDYYLENYQYYNYTK